MWEMAESNSQGRTISVVEPRDVLRYVGRLDGDGHIEFKSIVGAVAKLLDGERMRGHSGDGGGSRRLLMLVQ